MNVADDVLALLNTRRGHFLLESGHHGDLWLDLELLCHKPRLLEPLIVELAKRLSDLQIEHICGPMVEGAFVGLMVASTLGMPFSYSERYQQRTDSGLFPIGYRIPKALRASVCQKRVAIVNDVINAGSAVRGTLEDLEKCGAQVVAIGSLLVLGTAAEEFAWEKRVTLKSLATVPNNLWTESVCPLCGSGVPLEDVAGLRPRTAE